MHNILKTLIVITTTLLFFSFSNPKKTVTKTISAAITPATDTLTWKLLGTIDFEKRPNELYGEVLFPIINPQLKMLQKKTIAISGFIIPIDSKNYAISKNVFAACFFCGKSGPETIMGIKFKGSLPRLKTDQFVTLKGTFRYNDSDVEDWIYHIENAEIIQQD